MRIDSTARPNPYASQTDAAEGREQRLRTRIVRDTANTKGTTLTVGPKLDKMAREVVSRFSPRLTVVVDPRIADESWHVT